MLLLGSIKSSFSFNFLLPVVGMTKHPDTSSLWNTTTTDRKRNRGKQYVLTYAIHHFTTIRQDLGSHINTTQKHTTEWSDLKRTNSIILLCLHWQNKSKSFKSRRRRVLACSDGLDRQPKNRSLLQKAITLKPQGPLYSVQGDTPGYQAPMIHKANIAFS